MRNIFTLVLLFASPFAFSQGYQLTGGDSTLMQAQGGELRLIFANGSETSVGGGVMSGHAYAGVRETMTYRGLNVSAGDIQLPFILATDVGGPSLPMLGISVSKGDKDSSTSWNAFAGATARQLTMPYFFGGGSSEATAAFFFTHHFTPKWTFVSSEVAASKQTAIEELQYQPIHPFTLAIGSGVGTNAPFFASKAAWQSQHWNGVVAYTKRSPNFHRIVLPYGSVIEDSGLNASGGFTSHHFGVSGQHNTLLSDLSAGTTNVVQSTANSVNGYGSLSVVSVDGSEYFGKSGSTPTSGQSAGAGITTTWLTARATWYRALGHSQQTAVLTEHISQRFSVTEFIQKHDMNLGGEFHSNLVTVSGGYQMQFLPVLGTFDKTLVANIIVQLPNAMIVTGGTVTTPDGKTRWTAYSTKVGQGPYGARDTPVSGKYLYSGVVVDVNGRPVIGAAVLLGKVEVFSAHDGTFRMPSRKNKTLPVSVVIADFTAPGAWKAVTVPTSMTPDQHIQIVVTVLQP